MKKNMKKNLLRFSVYPINDIGEGILNGKYGSVNLNNISINLHSHYSYEGLSILDTDFIPKKRKVTYSAIFREVKEIYLVPVPGLGDSKDMDKMVVELPQHGLKICEYAPNYLLGLMTMFCAKKLPEGLPERVDIVAVDKSDSVMTRGEKGWLHVHLYPYTKDLGVFNQSHIDLFGMEKMILAENL
jgi:hypothetical protein